MKSAPGLNPALLNETRLKTVRKVDDLFNRLQPGFVYQRRV
ncbi:hypothetical protein [Candidatus Promineifilum breve]|nr:hypothetical protein [Candidatus Promineifilum breve]